MSEQATTEKDANVFLTAAAEIEKLRLEFAAQHGLNTTEASVAGEFRAVSSAETPHYPVSLIGEEGTEAEQRREAARQTYRQSVRIGQPMSSTHLGQVFERSRTWGRQRINEVREQDGMPPEDDLLGGIPKKAAQAPACHPLDDVPAEADSAPVEKPADAPADMGGMPSTRPVPKVAGAAGMYVVALMATVISANTSYRFFGEKLGITGMPFTVPAFGPLPGFTLDLERVALFGVMEVALIVLAYAMRANVIRSGRPGPAQWVAWGVCGFAAFAAWELSGAVAGTARVFLGPVFGLVMLHLALGIEVKVRRGRSSGVWAQAGREVRERLLSRLGLGNDERDALARTRDRAALKAARLAVEVSGMDKKSKVYGHTVNKLRKALHVAYVAHEPATRDRMLRELATLKHAEDLAHVDRPSPW